MADNVDGVTLHWATVAAPTVFTEIARITKITLGKITVKDVDTTTLASTDQWEESVPGRKNAGTLTISTLYDKDDEATLAAMAGTAYVWKVTFADKITLGVAAGSTWVVTGYITEMGDATTEGDKIRTDLSIKMTGKPEFTAFT